MMDVTHTADYLQTTVEAIETFAKAEQIPLVRFRGQLRFNPDDLDVWHQNS
jgi:hypothetical protein